MNIIYWSINLLLLLLNTARWLWAKLQAPWATFIKMFARSFKNLILYWDVHLLPNFQFLRIIRDLEMIRLEDVIYDTGSFSKIILFKNPEFDIYIQWPCYGALSRNCAAVDISSSFWSSKILQRLSKNSITHFDCLSQEKYFSNFECESEELVNCTSQC